MFFTAASNLICWGWLVTVIASFLSLARNGIEIYFTPSQQISPSHCWYFKLKWHIVTPNVIPEEHLFLLLSDKTDFRFNPGLSYVRENVSQHNASPINFISFLNGFVIHNMLCFHLIRRYFSFIGPQWTFVWISGWNFYWFTFASLLRFKVMKAGEELMSKL